MRGGWGIGLEAERSELDEPEAGNSKVQVRIARDQEYDEEEDGGEEEEEVVDEEEARGAAAARARATEHSVDSISPFTRLR